MSLGIDYLGCCEYGFLRATSCVGSEEAVGALGEETPGDGRRQHLGTRTFDMQLGLHTIQNYDLCNVCRPSCV